MTTGAANIQLTDYLQILEPVKLMYDQGCFTDGDSKLNYMTNDIK